MWEVVLRPGDPGTEAGVYLIWFGFVERVPASMAYDDPGIGTIRGRLLDADGNDPEEPFPTGLPCITPNLAVPNGFVVLHNDTRHPYVAATALADPLTGEYAFYDIPPDVYMIYACDVPIDYVWSQKQVRMSPGIDAVHDILVPRFYARMQGHVLDVHGVPVADTRVVFRLGPGNVWKDTRTDADGHYIFESLEEVETMGFLEAEAGGNMRAMAVDADADEPDFCRAATGKRGNHYVMFYSGVNYQVDFYLETLPALTGDVRGFVFHDSLQPPAWQGDGLWQEESEPTLGAVVVNLRDAYTDEVVATTTTGVFDEAAVLAQGWIKPLSTIPPDEFGGIFDGDIPGFYEFRDVAPGIYTVEVVALPGYAKTAVHSGVLVQAGIAAELDLGLATLVPSAGLIEGGVFDDLWIDTNPLSAFFEEKAVATGAPVSVTDHLGYVLDSFVQPSPLCYPSSPSGLCDRPDLGEEVAIERRVAPGPRIHIGNDPSHPEYNPNYMPMALNYDLGQGTAKYEADWSLIPAAFGRLGGRTADDKR